MEVLQGQWRGQGRSRDKYRCYTEEAIVWLRLRSFGVAREEGQMDGVNKMKECGVCRDWGRSQDGCKAVRNGCPLTKDRRNGAVIFLYFPIGCLLSFHISLESVLFII